MKTILDVSSIIYGGHNGLDRRIRGFPTGGLRKLFGIIGAGLSHSDFALCFDGGDLLKKELLPTYKAGRVPDYSVLAQIDLAKELLTDCNIPFYQDAKYEADDFIFSVVHAFADLNDAEDVVIYSDDRDISCCVTENVSVRNVTTNGICITKANYQDRVVRGMTIPYNTILLYKTFHGDPSDNYKALHIPGLTFESMAHLFVSQIEPLIGPTGFTELAYAEYEVFKALCESYKGTISDDMLDKLLKQGRIAYPQRLNVYTTSWEEMLSDVQRGTVLYQAERKHMKVFGSGSFDRKKFDFYSGLLGLSKVNSLNRIDKDSKEAQEFYTKLELRAKDLATGVMAVEKYRTKRAVMASEETLANMALPI